MIWEIFLVLLGCVITLAAQRYFSSSSEERNVPPISPVARLLVETCNIAYDITDRYLVIDNDIKARILNIIACLGPTTVLMITGNVVPNTRYLEDQKKMSPRVEEVSVEEITDEEKIITEKVTVEEVMND